MKAWFRGQIDSEAGQSFVTDDMVFRMPPSGIRDLTGGLPWRGRDSLRRLGILDRALYKTYGQPSTMNLHFMIEEGDFVLMQFDSQFDTWTDQKYHNYYVIAVRFEGDKIAEAWDLADTAYVEDTIFESPEAKAGFSRRIAEARAQMGAPDDAW